MKHYSWHGHSGDARKRLIGVSICRLTKKSIRRCDIVSRKCLEHTRRDGVIMPMDDDILNWTREELIAEVVRLRNGIRAHRDSSGHDLCWHHQKLWCRVPSTTLKRLAAPSWPQCLRGCIKCRESLDRELPDASRTNAESNDT